jgi:HSP20 family protein
MAYRRSQTGSGFGVRRDIDRLFEATIGRDDGAGAIDLPANVRESETDVVIEVEMPGVRPADVEVACERGAVVVRGHKRAATMSTDGVRYHVVERPTGAFERSFPLPAGIDDDRIEAELADGVLVLRLPKVQSSEPRRIEIRGISRER